MARKRPTASDVQQALSDFDAGNTEDFVSAGAAPAPESTLSPAQIRALRRSDRLTSAECVAHRQRTTSDQESRKPSPTR